MAYDFFCPTKEPEDVIPHLAKGVRHWKKDRSAYELAYAWWQAKGIPSTVRVVLEDCPAYRGAEFLNAFFEKQTGLGDRGRPSQTDLLVHVRSQVGFGVIAVEGKAGEPFGEFVSVWRKREPSADKEKRLRWLREILGLEEGRTNDLRYQLLHRTVAAITEAKEYGWSRALMLVHDFKPQVVPNDPSFGDFKAFSEALGIDTAQENKISNPLTFAGIDLYLGWVADRPLPESSSALTVRDFIVAWAKKQRLQDADNELAHYWTARFRLLAEAFGMAPDWESTPGPLPRCMLDIVQLAHTPFDYWNGVLEYRFLEDEKKVHDAQQPWIETASAALRRRYLDYAENLLLQYRPSLRGATTSLTHLIERGLPAIEPDSADFI